MASRKKKGPLSNYTANYESLLRAADEKCLNMLHCLDTRFDPPREVAVLVACWEDKEGLINMTPYAVMCEDNPYEWLIPPGTESDSPVPGENHNE